MRTVTLVAFLLGFVTLGLLSINSADATHFLTIDGSRVYNARVAAGQPNSVCVSADSRGEESRILQVLNDEPGWNELGYSVTWQPDCGQADIEARFPHLGNTWWVARVYIQGLEPIQINGERYWRQERFIVEFNADRYFPLSAWSKKLVVNHEWGHVIGVLADHPTESFGVEDLLMSYAWLRNMPHPVELEAVRQQYRAIAGTAPTQQSIPLLLIRMQGDSKVFLVLGSQRYWICSPESFTAAGFKWEEVQDLPADAFFWRLPGVFPACN